MKVNFRCFRSSFKSWQGLFEEAAAFASQFKPERLIGISHSSENTEGVVTVWYWEDAGQS